MDKQELNWDFGKYEVFERVTTPILTACPEIVGKNLSGLDAAKEIIALNDALAAYFIKV